MKCRKELCRRKKQEFNCPLNNPLKPKKIMSFVPNLPQQPTTKLNSLNQGFKEALSLVKNVAFLTKKVFML